MKSLTRFVISFFACGTLVLTAVAGPEHISSKDKEVMAAPAPAAPTWSGFYVGLNAGGEFGGDTNVDTVGTPGPFATTFGPESATSAALATGSSHKNDGEFVGGIQIGYNWQFSHFVLGVEPDFDGASGNNNAKNSQTMSPVPTFPSETMSSTEITSRTVNYIGTVRARVGWLPTESLLVYATGGLAYGGVSSTVSFLQKDTDTSFVPLSACPYCNNFGGTGSFDDTHVGYTVGGGMEWMFAPHWSLKGEYLYYDLGSASYAVSPLVNRFGTAFPPNAAGSTAFSSTARASTNFNGNIVRAGLNFHF